jgi:hypothetical protein
MKPFFKTLFGDTVNLTFVSLLCLAEWAMIRTGFTMEATLATPLIIMLGVYGLAQR